MKLYLTAVIKAKTPFRQEVQSVLANMVQETRKEKGCIQYDLHQEINDPNTFIFYEIWADQKALDSHNEQSYIKEFVALIDTKLQEQPSIYLTHKI
ncbi:putative quinol monooxygenase [Myroides sp. LJL116]